MASVRNLKKDINFVLGDIIEATYFAEISKGGQPTQKSEAIITDAIITFDTLMNKVNQSKKVENKKAHFKQVNLELEAKALELIEKINNI